MRFSDLPTNKGIRRTMLEYSRHYELDVCTRNLVSDKKQVLLKSIIKKFCHVEYMKHNIYGYEHMVFIDNELREKIKDTINSLCEGKMSYDEFMMLKYHARPMSYHRRFVFDNFIETIRTFVLKSKHKKKLKYSSDGEPYLHIEYNVGEISKEKKEQE